MGILEHVGIAFLILGWMIRSIYKAMRWSAQRIKVQSAIFTPQTQAIVEEDAIADRTVAIRPVVTREATRTSFSNSELQLKSLEPAPRYSFLETPNTSPTPKQFSLFENADDLVRAMIFQEILRPPRSRHISYHPDSYNPK